ncbi:hypothetical protein NBRC10513v2_002236 [Rhodotorula toruloides]|uniref:ISWI chromatin-remodeling complex ATPase ISW2 n=1 Tax=Rhodotorula toruloides TaxID=5286 RepID=A0A2T0AIT5_RHOTO|nr:ISWI chromatin-remodeling complex ATPase ISW2 [Rhodotorula toruloides]
MDSSLPFAGSSGSAKRPLEHLARTDSLVSLNAHLQHDLSLKSGSATPVSGEGSQGFEGVQTAETSAQASPRDVIVIDDGDEVPLGRGKRVKRAHVPDDVEVLHFSSPPADSKKRKGKGKAKEAVAIADGPGWFFSSTKDQFEARMDNFILANSNLFLPLLPKAKNNYVASLLASVSPQPITPYRPVAQPTAIANGQPALKDYQLAGLSFLTYLAENGMNGILADEMGLGKTLQTLSLLAYLSEQHGQKGPHLLVCPLSVLGSWMSEIARWLPSFTAIRYHGPAGERERLKSEVAEKDPDLLVTTYEAYTAEAIWFRKKRWAVVVLDEGHRIKNHASNAAEALQNIPSRMRLILSGTPLQNNLVELWALLHFLFPKVFKDHTLKPFQDSFNLSQGLYDQAFLAKSQKLLELIMLRRTKEGVKGQLSVPPREELTLYVPLSPVQRFWYIRILSRSDTMTLGEVFGDSSTFDVAAAELAKQQVLTAEGKKRGPAVARLARLQKALERRQSESGASSEADADDDVTIMGEEAEDGAKQAIARAQSALEDAKKSEAGGGSYQKLMNLLVQLRKCCDHPYLLPNSEPDGDLTIDEHLVAASAKLVALDKLLKDVIPKGERVLVFSGYTRMLDILEDFCALRSYKYARLDGSTSRPRRALDIRLFQQAASPYQLYLISTRAGGLGINLTAATTVVLFDQDWNPQVDIQAIARAHRIGQTKTVKVYRLVTQGSVEEQAMTRLRKKLYLSAKIMDGMRNVSDAPTDEAVNETSQTEDDAPRMSRGELAAILKGGTGALAAKWDTTSGDAFDAFRAASFDELCERGRQRDEDKEVSIKIDLGEQVSEEEMERRRKEEEDAERALLEGKEAVTSRKFEGKLYAASNDEIRKEWQNLQKREHVSRTVVIGGHSVARETLSNGSWEAVKTLTSDPKVAAKLGDAKRTKRKFEHQDACLTCGDGGEIYLCSGCPRAYHAGDCSGMSKRDLAATVQYYCQQHTCSVCLRNTQAAGGLLFRCQTCPAAFCEDDLPTTDLEVVGEVLPEFLLLGYGKRKQAYWIHCPSCVEYWAEYPEAHAAWRKEQDKIEKKAHAEGHVW